MSAEDARASSAAPAAGSVQAGDSYDALWRTGLINVATIARRELTAYFVSPMGWVVGALVILPTSLYGYLGPVLNQQQATMAPLFQILVNLFLLLLVPLYTMRLLAEERKGGTLEVMLTSPVRDLELVLGKWIGAYLFFIASMAFTLLYVALLDYYFPEKSTLGFLGLQLHVANLDWGTILTGYIGLLLAGAAFTAIGLFASSLTQNQIIAAVLGFVLLMVVWYVGVTLGQFLLPPAGTFFDYVSGYNRYTAFTQGQIALKDVVYFVSLVVAALFLSSRVLQSRKWR